MHSVGHRQVYLTKPDSERAEPLLSLGGFKKVKAGRALGAIRRYHGLSLSELARKMELAKSYISDLENDKKQPSVDVFERYSKEFKIPVSSIILLTEIDSDTSDTLRLRVRRFLSGKVLRILERLGEDASSREVRDLVN